MRLDPKTLAGACAAFFLSANLYAGSAAEAVQAQGAFARAVPPGQSNSAAFMTLTNASDANHALVSAESSAAKAAELHSHTMDEGMMKMRRVEKIDLPAGGTVELEPGGFHLMLIGLERQLSPGEQIDVTLVFEDGSRETLTAPVRTVQETMQHRHH
jgi:copper(I)-binding protein